MMDYARRSDAVHVAEPGAQEATVVCRELENADFGILNVDGCGFDSGPTTLKALLIRGTFGTNTIYPNPPNHRDMACPICGEVKGLNSFNEDHCPQRGSQSCFGSSACVVRVCIECNGSAGRGYESEAAKIRNGTLPTEGDMAVVRDDGSSAPLGILGFTRTGSAELATDLKSAFLLAFVTLGYRFAFGSALVPIRQAIRDGNAPPEGMGGPVDMTGFPEFTVGVLESGGVVVSGPTGSTNWWLPAGDFQGPANLGDSSFQPFAWPNTHTSGNRRETSGLLQQGLFFHGDYCDNEVHHAPLGNIQLAPWTL